MTTAGPAMSGMLPLRDTDPREVGAYRLLGRLGEGGQGVVFLALSPAESRVAVKLLPPTTDPQVRSRFLKEVAAAQRVARFCTAQVLDAGIFERRPFIVSEYVSGPSLVEVVQQHGPRSGATLERIAIATLTALGAMHAAGMVHRDFKPGNVLLGPDGPVVIDFGLAAVPGMTTTGLSGQVAVGTPAFMAPEQLAGVRVTAAADMWSWAVTIAFTGTGELPFKGESLTATAYAILHAEPTVGPLPEPLGSLVHRCLERDPVSRPSARDALGELAAAGARLLGPLPPMAAAPLMDDGASGRARAPAAPPEPRRGSDDLLTGARPPPEPQPPPKPQPAPEPHPVPVARPEPHPVPVARPEPHPVPVARPEPHPVPTARPEPHPVPTARPARRGRGRARRRWRVAAVVTSGLLVAGAGAVALVLAQPDGSTGRPAGSHAGTSQGLAAAARPRAQAIAWILDQVSRAAVVSCDPLICADLFDRGFPSANLLTLGPASNDPLGSNLVVATAAVRAQYRGRLASVYAPAVIASFGSGNARIDIRLVFPGGTTGYRAVQGADLRARKAADAQLLTNSHITCSATARAQLLSGGIDPRLPLLLAAMAHSRPVHIVDFSGQSPGGGPASLLRSVDLATTDPAAHRTRTAYLRWMHGFVNAQRAPYRPGWSQVTLPAGRAVVRIGYGAPSPLS